MRDKVLDKVLPPEVKRLIRNGFVEDIKETIHMKEEKIWKEIAESAFTLKIFKKHFEGEEIVWDVGTGMGLTALFIAVALKPKKVVGIDIKSRKTWELFSSFADNLVFVEEPVEEYYKKEKPDFIVGVHNCRRLSITDIKIATRERAKILLLPCCEDFNALKKELNVPLHQYFPVGDFESQLKAELRYRVWIAGLSMLIKSYDPNYEIKVIPKNKLKRYTPKNIFVVGIPT